VTIGITSNDTTEGVVSTSSLIFTPLNWNVPQTVTVTGVNDDIDDGDITFSIVTAAAVSADGVYNNMNAADVLVINIDDDTAGIMISPTSGLITTEGGGIAVFTVVLTSQPAASVSISFTSNNPGEGSASGAVTLNAATWNVPQTVTVTG